MGAKCNVRRILLGILLVNRHIDIFKFFIALKIRYWFVWDVILGHLVFGYRRFEVAYWTHLQGYFDRWCENTLYRKVGNYTLTDTAVCLRTIVI
jgi:hypothetical protein